MEQGRITVENRYTTEFEERGYSVRRGWDETLRDQLVESSHQPHILEATPKDAASRFIDAEAADAWYHDHERVIYSLGTQAVLAGIIWFGRDPRPELEADFTFAIRMYEDAKEKRLAKGFMRAAHADFRQCTRNESGIWLETDHTNGIARRLYLATDYEEVEPRQNDDRVLMVRRK